MGKKNGKILPKTHVEGRQHRDGLGVLSKGFPWVTSGVYETFGTD